MLTSSSLLPRLKLDQFGLGGLCGCCGTATLCISVCTGPSFALAGADVTIDGDPVGTTDGTGCVDVTGISGGSHAVVATVNGLTVFSGTRTYTPGSPWLIGINVPPNILCCREVYIPYRLTGTDAVGAFRLDYTGAHDGLGQPIWFGCRVVPGVSACTCSGGTGVVNPVATQSIRVCYSMKCLNAADDFTGDYLSAIPFSLSRTWGWISAPVTFTPVYYADPAAVASGCSGAITGCATIPGGLCGGGFFARSGTATPTSAATPTNSDPFAIAFTLSGSPGPPSDPIGGNVTVSQ